MGYGWGYGGYGWGHFWWVILPLAGMAMGAFFVWLRHKREIATLEVLRTYAAQGKEPPADVARILQNSRRPYGAYRDWRRAIFFACLAAAFAAIGYFGHFGNGVRPHHGFIVPVAVFAALAVWSALSGLLLRRHDER